MEMLNVIQGGTLNQHLGLELHRHTPGVFADHRVQLEAGSLAARVVGGETTEVKSAHHQGVEQLGEGVVVAGHADDGVVEALELPEKKFAVGVLWHPEEDERSRVIGSLVNEARERMEAAAPRLREASPPPARPREAHG
jgi:putative glutamine amidotransferase